MSKTIYAVVVPHGKGAFFYGKEMRGTFQIMTEQPLDLWSREHIKQHVSDWALIHPDKGIRDFEHLAVLEVIEGGRDGKKTPDTDRGTGGNPSTSEPA